ncbi:hypothetical protein OG607_44225 [Streptomyces sp. NBC_01537]|uniref:hypothetical protein n=1 Tax=Streptomyces sp. NBC_01537 TaxID=2903896 RepID=UPI00386F9CBF
MTVTAHLIATIAIPAGPGDAPPGIVRWPAGRRLVIRRTDAELIAHDLDRLRTDLVAAPVRFPAPWPRSRSQHAIGPALDFVVFAGPHALRAVGPGGEVRWEHPHPCWELSCLAVHASYEEYAADPGHRDPAIGSCWISADGSTVWAHVQGEKGEEEWLVLDAVDGRVLARTRTGTGTLGSEHLPPPDPGRMGLSVGEGQDGSPLLWARWDGRELTVDRIGDDLYILLDVSPSGDTLLAVTHGGPDLLVGLRADDGSEAAELESETLPLHPGADPDEDTAEDTLWDYDAGYVDEDTVLAATTDTDEEYGAGRHWIVDAPEMRLRGEVVYPFPNTGRATALGDGTWLTFDDDGSAVHQWRVS